MEGRFRGLAGRIAGDASRLIGRTLFPHFCLVCGEEGQLLCRTCDTARYSPERGCFYSVNTRKAGRVRCFSGGRYADPVLREILHLYKYGRVDEAGRILADFLARAAARHIGALLDGDSDPVVVPLPMSPINLALRGFNQAESLARAVADELELESADAPVRRKFAWRPQASLHDRKRRMVNVRSSFLPCGDLHGRDIMLVDDVFTTGATIRECIKALIEANAGRITVVTALKG